MNELAMQALVVKTVNDAGGFAMKLSHRFLVGVPDLLVKLGPTQAGVLEVKRHDLSPIGVRANMPFRLDVTPAQRRYLRDADRGGMPSGVMSFIQTGRGASSLLLQVLTFREAEQQEYAVHPDEHQGIGDVGIAAQTGEWQQRWEFG